MVSGLLILTSTTGAHETAVSLTAVLFLVFCNVALMKEMRGGEEGRGATGSSDGGSQTKSDAIRALCVHNAARGVAHNTNPRGGGRELKYPFIFSSCQTKEAPSWTKGPLTHTHLDVVLTS